MYVATATTTDSNAEGGLLMVHYKAYPHFYLYKKSKKIKVICFCEFAVATFRTHARQST